MESSVANVYETFIAQHITRWDQVSDLIAALAKKFPACKYPRTNRDSNNRVLKMLESFMNVASGNRPKEILVDLLNGRTRKKLRKQITEALGSSSLIIDNLKEMINQCSVRELQNTTSAEATRFNILQAFVHNRGRKNLQAEGFLIGTTIWSSVTAYVQENGILFYDATSIRGRKGLSIQLKGDIKKFVSLDTNSKIIPQGRSKVANARALTKPKNELYRLFPRKDEISLDAFTKQLNGKKNSAMPNLREFVHETDKCPVCPQRRVIITNVRKVISQCSEPKRQELTTKLDELVQISQDTPAYELSRNDISAWTASITYMAEHTDVTAATLGGYLRRICALGFHVYQKNVILESWRQDCKVNTDKVIIKNSDWKENAKRGHGPVEDAMNIY